MNEITITLPEHAIRYLRKMCEVERGVLSELMTTSFGPAMAIQVAFDSLNAIESALPNDD